MNPFLGRLAILTLATWMSQEPAPRPLPDVPPEGTKDLSVVGWKEGKTIPVRVPLSTPGRELMSTVSFPEDSIETAVTGWPEGEITAIQKRGLLFLRLTRRSEGQLNVYESTTPEQDRDGNILRIGVTFPIDLHLDWSLAPYVTYDRYDAQGNDYKSHGWEGGVTVLSPVYAGFKFALTASYGVQNYDKPNSLTNFTEKRLDRPVSATLVITFKQLENALGAAPSITVTWYKHDSNISAFNYTRWAPQMELGITALSF
jgi:hypothetical protein